jgi:hypothetical protein
MKRRDFLEKTLLTSVASALVATNTTANNDSTSQEEAALLEMAETKIVYVVEAGQFGIDKYFVLGFLVCNEASDTALGNRCTSARTSLNFNSKLGYFSNDQYKQPYATSLINYFVGAANVSFHAIVVDLEKAQSSNPVNDNSFKQNQTEKLKYYNQLSAVVNLPQTTRFLTKSQSPFGPSAKFKKAFNTSISNAGFVAVNTLDNDVLQFAGFLAGAVRSELMKSTQDAVKLALNKHLKQQLNITTMGIGTNLEGKFRISAAT